MKKSLLVMSVLAIVVTSIASNLALPTSVKFEKRSSKRVDNRKGVKACIVDNRWGVKCTAPFSVKCKEDDGCAVVGISTIQTFFPSVTTAGQWLETNPESSEDFMSYLMANDVLDF